MAERSYSKDLSKKDIVHYVAEDAGILVKEANRAVESMMDIISQTVNAGYKVRLTNFGVFDSTEWSERTARNLNTGETIIIPAQRKFRFKSGKMFK